MAGGARKTGAKPKRPRNPLAPVLWRKRPAVKPSAKAYSRKTKHRTPSE